MIRSKARLAGLFYLIITFAAPFAEVFVRGRLVVWGDAAATAANIMAHESLYRWGGVADLLAFSCDAAVAVLLYELLKPAGRTLALFGLSFRLVYAGIAIVNTIGHFAPVVLLGGAHFPAAVKVDQLQAFSLLALYMHRTGYNVGLVIFGIHCLLVGILIFRSWFLPRLLGVLMAIAGVCYVANSLAYFVAPALKAHLYPTIMIPCGIAEVSLLLWLLVVGVNASRWNEQASIGGANPAGSPGIQS